MGNIDTNQVTHSGRHGAMRELEDMELHIDNIAWMGHWAHGKMHMYYLSKLDVPGAFAMAGFHNMWYDIKRDRLTPPLDLQRQVFPWIENQYTGADAVEWKTICDRIMKDEPETSTAIIESVFAQDNIFQAQERRQADGFGGHVHSHYEIAKRGVLVLFIWLHRVILEDAALFRNCRGER